MIFFLKIIRLNQFVRLNFVLIPSYVEEVAKNISHQFLHMCSVRIFPVAFVDGCEA